MKRHQDRAGRSPALAALAGIIAGSAFTGTLLAQEPPPAESSGEAAPATGEEAPPAPSEEAWEETAPGADPGEEAAWETGEPDLEFGEVFPADEEPKFRVNGYLQNQTGVFISRHRTHLNDKGLPLDHGDKFGKLSMFRNTLQLEADWTPGPAVSLHAIVRGVRSLKLSVDKDAQVPHEGYFGNNQKTIDWVADTYYQELDLREFYMDINASEYLNLRLGRQQVAWGETGQYRLLDVVNPTDSTWHFGPLESFEDQRIPLWMLKGLLWIPPLQGSLEVVWIPMLDRPEDTVTVPLTFVGAWGLPPVPAPDLFEGDDSVAPWKIRKKVFLYPGRDIENSRAGARWQGEIGNFTYTLVYFYTHQLSPPIPLYTYAQYGAGKEGVDVYLFFPRQHVAGMSLETALPYPLGTNLKFEAAFEPDRTYTLHSAENSLTDRIPYNAPNGDTYTFFHMKKKKVFSYAVSFQQPLLLDFLNREQSVYVVAQFMHTWITDFDASDRLVEVPGYDGTLSSRHSFTVVGAIFTNYLHGLLSPRIVGAWLPGNGGFLSAQLGVTLGDHWRFRVAWDGFFGDNPYKGVGLFRDRDEVNVTLKYQF